MTTPPGSPTDVALTRRELSGDGRSFEWSDRRRFVEVHPVCSGWLIIWGKIDDHHGRVRLGNRIYRDERGARNRLAAVVVELTADRSASQQAVERFDRDRILPRPSAALPAPSGH